MKPPHPNRVLLVIWAVAATGLWAGATEPDDGRRARPRTRQAGLEGFDAVVRVTRDAGKVRVGEEVSLSVTVSTLRPVGHAPFHLRFDPAVLRFESADEGAFLSADDTETAFMAAVTSGGDAVVIGLSRLGRAQGVTGDGELCRLRFTAIGAGDAALSFDRATLRDGHNRALEANFLPTTVAVEE